ncbi:peptidylprolyl isomerase [Halalkalibacter krulwichiae]|uniref:Peptidyl-prolyl cis-trans isomerase n=1 Tax=Halalkalibacter krulwichiae TaxID=199441 RepID=A0A1X9MMQ0_9BACI|nr:peptidylprolyl isomerase [Halalkalibacter krulwichiae]ARK32492.1 Putative bifunctional phosphatase/peptidyl-prolyl cis-trans isomerase [Halalkalibacter krulwichiae]
MRNMFITLLITLVFALSACGTAQEEEQVRPDPVDEGQEEGGQAEENEPIVLDVEENPVVTITLENDEEIVLELYPHIAPNTVLNFISLVEQGFYDGLIFHRVIPGFMIQGGDPSGDGTGGPDYSIAGEFTDNGFENPLNHERGVLSMARSQHPDSAGSQFFIMVEDTPSLDGQYASFGKVIEGIEHVDQIVNVERDFRDKPEEDQRIKTMTVDTKDYEYPEPQVIQ